MNQTFELLFIGRLIGHLNLVLGAVFLENFGVLVSIDEKVTLKFWDIKRLCCLKSIEIQGKAHVRNMLLIEKTN